MEFSALTASMFMMAMRDYGARFVLNAATTFRRQKTMGLNLLIKKPSSKPRSICEAI